MIAIPVALLILMICGGIWAYKIEKRLWNNGICAKYNEPWVYFDSDSQGGRGYKCHEQYLWVSYPVDTVPSSPIRVSC